MGAERVLLLSVERFQGRDGIQVAQPAGTIFTLRHGKIVLWQAFWDREQPSKPPGWREAVSAHRQQARLDAPIEEVWSLIGAPRRYPEWWPRVIEVHGERFEEGDEYVQVTRDPSGRVRNELPDRAGA